jgi:hypothetical protein
LETIDELTVFLATATADGILGRLLYRGAAWSLMREEGVLPSNAPPLGATIETDLAEHGFALLRGAMALRALASASELTSKAFERAANAFEALVRNGDPEAPDRGFRRMIAAAAYHLAGFSAVAYPTRFCRECGHEVHVITKTEDAKGILFLPRGIDDAPLDDQEGETAGYLTTTGDGDPEYVFTGEIEAYPEDWREERNGIERLRANRKRRMPQMITVAPDGRCDSAGKSFWFIPGKFGFCPCCLDQPHPNMRERTKLTGLSGEGRSSATTLLVSTALEWMNGNNSGVPKEKRKLLGFTDNRQDAALQAGHFNDYLFVSLLRGAILRAVLDAGDDGLAEDEFGLRVVKALGFTAGNKVARVHWMLDPEAGAVVREDAQRSLAKVLAHRLWTDLRRGWRYTKAFGKVAREALILMHFEKVDEAIAAGDAKLLASHDGEAWAALRPPLQPCASMGERGGNTMLPVHRYDHYRSPARATGRQSYKTSNELDAGGDASVWNGHLILKGGDRNYDNRIASIVRCPRGVSEGRVAEWLPSRSRGRSGLGGFRLDHR